MANNANEDPQPIRGDRGATILGPRNIPLERENLDLLASPYTDSGTIPNLKFSFATARNRILTGGWARESRRVNCRRPPNSRASICG
jgi:oxalate decarboxylase